MSIKLRGKKLPIGREKDTMRILFSGEKMFDLDGIYNSGNDRIWAVNREEANRRGGKKQQGNFAEKVMVWLAVCSEGVTPLVLFEKGTLDHHQESTACCSTIRKQRIWKQLDLPTRQQNTTCSPRDERIVFPTFSFIS